MAINFRKEINLCKMLNPATGFSEEVFPIEFRTDPLTKEIAVIIERQRHKLDKPDLSRIVARSLEIGCPFCPEAIDRLTPRFPPDFVPQGRLRVGESIVFPNAFPYVPYHALTVFNRQHFVNLLQFTEEMLVNGFMASQAYLSRVLEIDPGAKYCCIAWNYMPPASSSQLHPHLHNIAGQFPLTYHRGLLELSQKYYSENKANYWSDLAAEEKRLGERYVGSIGNTLWFTSFAPRSWQLDILVLFPERDSLITLPEEDIKHFSQGLRRVFAYMDSQNFYSFNLCLYSGILGERYFWTQARLIQRAFYTPLEISDFGSPRLLLDTLTAMRYPEEVCNGLKSYFG